MPGTISEPLEFAPTEAVLAAALGEFDELAERGGGRTRVPVLPRATPLPADGDLPALAVENAGGVVHVGSTYLEPLETAGDPRVTLASLADARRFGRERVDAVHLQIVAPETDRFTALSTAFQNCGAYVDVPDGAIVEAPLQLLWMSRPGIPSAVFPHTVIRLGAGAHATIVERHIGSTETFIAGIADLGGALVRSACGAQLAGPGASAETNAFFFARGFTHVGGRGRFSGALRFGPNATRCVASMRDDGLILSRAAYLDAAPVLAVPAHRVSASHATNIGSLDEEELFYVQSRGISRGLAERMMAMAFFEPAISRFPGDAVRDEVRTALDSHLNDVPDTFE